VPDRLAEGYGPNAAAIAGLIERGASLVVCVDCGISAHEALAVALGRADVVVLDHHKSDGPPPRVSAAVNPNRLDCSSGLRQLCAAGVAFLAAWRSSGSCGGAASSPARAEPTFGTCSTWWPSPRSATWCRCRG
jgi:single-stranded-DNA-specific exonuclease